LLTTPSSSAAGSASALLPQVSRLRRHSVSASTPDAISLLGSFFANEKGDPWSPAFFFFPGPTAWCFANRVSRDGVWSRVRIIIKDRSFYFCGGSRAIWCHLCMIILCNCSTVLSGNLHMQMDVVREFPEFEVKLLGDCVLLLTT